MLIKRNVTQLDNALADIAVAPSSSVNRGDAKLIICRLVDSPAPSTAGSTSLSRDEPSILMECNWLDRRTVSPRHIESSSDSCALLKSSPCKREYGSRAASNSSCNVPELCGPPLHSGVGYHDFDTTESELRLSGGKSSG